MNQADKIVMYLLKRIANSVYEAAFWQLWRV